MTKIDMTQESEAAQDNALLSLLVTVCRTDGWVVFTHNNGETVDVIAGLLTDELRAKLVAALNISPPSLDMVSVERVHDLLANINEYAIYGGDQERLIHEARTHTAALMGITASKPAEDDEAAPRDDIDWTEPPFGHPGPGFDDTPPEVYEDLYPYQDRITAQDFLAAASGADDEHAEAEYEAREAQRQRAHDADIDSRGYEPYGERES